MWLDTCLSVAEQQGIGPVVTVAATPSLRTRNPPPKPLLPTYPYELFSVPLHIFRSGSSLQYLGTIRPRAEVFFERNSWA